MLQTAVLQQSDSVFIDLLTLQDLELLKTKKAAASGVVNGPASAPARQLPASNKRYLILTYASEFDRVHYPLPLLPEEQPDPQRLKDVIKQLRQQLGEIQAAQQLQQTQLVPRQRSRNSHNQVGTFSASMATCCHPRWPQIVNNQSSTAEMLFAPSMPQKTTNQPLSLCNPEYVVHLSMRCTGFRAGR